MNSIQWLLKVAIPCVIRLFILTVWNGLMAWRHINCTLRVLFCFFTGRSHLAYPQPLKQLRKKKSKLAHQRRHYGTSLFKDSSSGSITLHRRESSLDDSVLRERFSSTIEHDRPSLENISDNLLSEERQDSSDTTVSKCWVQRRVQLGPKGEVLEWLPKMRTKLLVPSHYHLCYSESLHILVSNIVGPIQQPTVSVLPTRHTAPQWPPHASSRTSARQGGFNDDFQITTDEYSSSATTNHHVQRRATIVGLNGSGGGAHADSGGDVSGENSSIVSERILNNGPAVVYRRESSRRVQFVPTVGSRMPLHPIASITAHHVLSYQATRQKVLIVDLDETLCFVSTKSNAFHRPPSFSEVIPRSSGAELFHVWERPHLRLFLRTAARLFNLVLFTSSTKPYADSILRRLDPEHLIKRRYYRQHCRQVVRSALGQLSGRGEASNTDPISGSKPGRSEESVDCVLPEQGLHASSASTAGSTELNVRTHGSMLNKSIPAGGSGTNQMVLLKDLRILKVPPELLIMVDNMEESVAANRENAIVIPPFFPSNSTDVCGDDNSEDVLLSLTSFLEALLVVPDVRSILRHGCVVETRKRVSADAAPI